MKKYKIGVIGAGAIAQACHIPGYIAASNCELGAVADPEEKCLRMVRDRGWKFTSEYCCCKDMLAKEKLDVVSICTPNKFHAEIAIACMKAGADLLLEKPIALNMDEADAILKTAREYKRRVMVGFSHRFNELNIAAKAAVEAGEIGKPYMIRVRFAHCGPIPGWAKTDWFYKPELAGGGALMDMAVHAFDIVQWFISPVQSIYAQVATLRKDIPVDDNVVAVMEFEDKCLGYIECGWTSPSGFTGIEIMGDNGVIFCDYGKNKATAIKGRNAPDGSSSMVETVLIHKPSASAWVNEMKYFTSHLDSKEAFTPGVESGINTLRLVLAAYESSRTGRKVNIKQ
ncbi:MAG TPA: hypothetical protein DCZ94_18975 [Lentisphaeria bacterium]|nr:MAG: hypothetical protein A2X48_08785 [Lentisphaerae bacterium GWF2_49_21]HBC89028.1 hypothetical protein [Lentisphaeria bacterium]